MYIGWIWSCENVHKRRNGCADREDEIVYRTTAYDLLKIPPAAVFLALAV
jgi:hypothetical protein